MTRMYLCERATRTARQKGRAKDRENVMMMINFTSTIAVPAEFNIPECRMISSFD